MKWLHLPRRRSVLDADPKSPDRFKAMSGDALRQMIASSNRMEGGDGAAAEAELTLRHISALERSAEEASRTGWILIVLTVVLIAMTGALIYLTTQL